LSRYHLLVFNRLGLSHDAADIEEPVMVKRKTKKGSAASRVPRKEPYSSQRLEAVIERVREQAAKLSTLARTMGDLQLDQVVIDGHAMLLRGLNQIDNFIDNANRAVREAKTAKDQF
jgi:hypothetical protein